MNILVTGGAGYIGSIVAAECIRQGHTVIVLDNLVHGHKAAVPPEAIFVNVDLLNAASLKDVFHQMEVEAVMHLAAESIISRAEVEPSSVFRQNVLAGINLLDVMRQHGTKRIVFSSSAAVYGQPSTMPIEEDHPTKPSNAYGDSKIMFESILKRYEQAYGIKHVSLRYFNAAGATADRGEDHRPESHLIPNVLRSVQNRDQPLIIYGTDYPTRDGTCVRDYVHVYDIARAHLMALDSIESLSGSSYNLGTNTGYSILEVIEAAQLVTDQNIPYKTMCRRSGDAAMLVASNFFARRDLGWRPQYSEIHEIITSAWKWILAHPLGYDEGQY